MHPCRSLQSFLLCTLTVWSVFCSPSLADDQSQLQAAADSPATEEIPDVPIVIPPDLPNRPQLLPAYPTTNFAQPNCPSSRYPQSSGKIALAWRARAAQLRDSTGPLKAIGTTFAGSYEDGLMTLVSLLPQFGLRVAVLNSKAGEVLAVPVDNSNRASYVFTVNEMPPLTVNIKATQLGQTKAPQTFSLLKDLMNAVPKTPAGKGILQ